MATETTPSAARHTLRNEWIGRIDQDAVLALAVWNYGRNASGRVVGKTNGSFNVCFFIELGDGNEPADAEVDASDDGQGKQKKGANGHDAQRTRISIPHVHALGHGVCLLRKEDTTARADVDATDDVKPDDAKPDETQCYLIMDFVEGEKLLPSKLRDLDPETWRTFLSQMVDILADLRTLEFPLIGPVNFLPNTPIFLPESLPPFASARDFIRFRHRVMSVAFEEPCRDHTLEDIRHELFAVHHLEAAYEDAAVGRMPGTTSWSSASASQNAPLVEDNTDGVSRDDKGPFILTHTDMHTCNVFIDDKWNIKAVIDRESAYTVPKCAFTPPSWITGHCGTFYRVNLPKWRRVHAEFRNLLAEKART
ncbi:hypothetical protein SCUCBS95973_002475 [Sporothrix curviconia]|uniref:Aminoglycoside phosphotransferase domain-containing protein n=1 Tax=Sporothrix curviconia TaxID=1260050 RepID=A0ABP0B7F3_9PEZI